ncbi:DUF3558 domain-containing protein [Micromonospora cremea]|uniref:DUF3558 domain-containing protein n=1 Tax=Micromonospora cremea TaxID=709881 RepID=A0A1N5W4C4_9ACTN|nr:DUF3558 domain-containing protein [Micromonospora cremea]SIM79849.1 Protein of unknown function [Micromonospora cremea]
MTHLGTGQRWGVAAATILTLTALAGCGMIGGDDAGDTPAAGAGKSVAATPDDDPSVAASAEAPPAAAAVDACALVTRQEAEKLAGTRLEDPLEKPTDRDTCTYTGPVTGPTAQVEVYVGDGAKKFLDIDRELGHKMTPISGVGDEAYAEDGTVFVSKGGVWACVRLVRSEDPALYRAGLEAVARTAAGRL